MGRRLDHLRPGSLKSSNQVHGSLDRSGLDLLAEIITFRLQAHQCSGQTNRLNKANPTEAARQASPRHYSDLTVQLVNMSQNPFQDQLNRLQAIARRTRMPGGGGAPNPRGAAGMAVLAVAGIGGAMLLQNSLFNVDGGHRAIKYKRISGVSKEIYSEGLSRPPASGLHFLT